MTSTVLVHGKLFRDPERKTSSGGKVYVAATIRDGQGDDAAWWKVLVFSESAAEELLSLGEGDGVAVSGAFKADTYDKGGSTRLSLTVFADRVISAKRQKRDKRDKATPETPLRIGDPLPFSDEIPF